MTPLPMLVLVLATAACGAAAGRDALRPSAACTSAPPAADGPVLLQQPPQDVSGPFYSARTDGPCGLLVIFTGAPEGDGPCDVAEYVGRLEPRGGDLRLVVDARHTGEAPAGLTACPDIGAHRQLAVALDAPLGVRRVVDPQGHAIHLVDGDRLLRPGALPPGWSVAQEGASAQLPAHWSFELRGPDGAWGELRQGGPDLGRQSPGPSGFDHRQLAEPAVRGTQGLLVSFDAEQPGDHQLTWVEGDRGFALQVLGPLPDPGVLVRIADGLRG